MSAWGHVFQISKYIGLKTGVRSLIFTDWNRGWQKRLQGVESPFFSPAGGGILPFVVQRATLKLWYSNGMKAKATPALTIEGSILPMLCRSFLIQIGSFTRIPAFSMVKIVISWWVWSNSDYLSLCIRHAAAPFELSQLERPASGRFSIMITVRTTPCNLWWSLRRKIFICPG